MPGITNINRYILDSLTIQMMINICMLCFSTSSKEMPPPSERFEARRKKKNFYAALKKQEDTKLMELAEKYRDRARERRDNSNPDYTREDIQGANSAYRAVAPDIKSGMDAAERRRQQIQESKFLGGDMEHTHLVKGLDYALLQKVRSEIVTKEHEQELEMEKIAEQAEEKAEEEKQQKLDEPEYKTAMGKNIFNTLQFYRSRHIQRNELFAPGRMAYIIELEDENAETDIPTTLIRSKADVPVVHGEIQTLTTNDIVINKLAQILSYLRQGGRGKKNKKRDKDKPLLRDSEYDQEPEYGRAGPSRIVDKYRDRDSYRDRDRERDSRRYEKKRDDDVSIYDDVGEYKPSTSRRGGESSSKSRADDKRRDYFDKSGAQEELEAGGLSLPPPLKISGANLIAKLSSEPEGYAECYPGLQEMNDAIDDSDDEVDYTKMDLGNKKGPIGKKAYLIIMKTVF